MYAPEERLRRRKESRKRWADKNKDKVREIGRRTYRTRMAKLSDEEKIALRRKTADRVIAKYRSDPEYREKHKKNNKEWFKNNREKCRSYNKEYCEKNREKINTKRRERYKSNLDYREKSKEYYKEYCVKNKDKLKAYREKNRKQLNAKQRERYKSDPGYRKRVNEKNRKWLIENTEESRVYWRAYGKAYREKNREELNAKKRELYDPCKSKARRAVSKAIKDGTLIKPEKCQRCDKKKLLEGHHHKGYDVLHQLDVQWLCRSCHKIVEPPNGKYH